MLISVNKVFKDFVCDFFNRIRVDLLNEPIKDLIFISKVSVVNRWDLILEIHKAR